MGPTMPDAEFFRDKARRCRELLRVAIKPEVIEQLRRWAIEFDEEADAVEARDRSPSRHFAE
jgi:hypothetical protein